MPTTALKIRKPMRLQQRLKAGCRDIRKNMQQFGGMILLSAPLSAGLAQSGQVTAVVGGTLIDGFGSTPITNSVIIIEGERITAVGRIGELEVPSGAKLISTEGMTVLPGLWDMHVHLMINGHTDYAHWDEKYPPLFEKVIMPASAKQLLMAGVTSARDLGGPLTPASGFGMLLTPAASRAQRFMSPAPSFSTNRIRGPILSAGV